MGVNQYGMTNNFSPKSSNTEKVATDFWEMRNKANNSAVSPMSQKLEPKADKNAPFMDRYMSDEQYNTLHIDRNCASC